MASGHSKMPVRQVWWAAIGIILLGGSLSALLSFHYRRLDLQNAEVLATSLANATAQRIDGNLHAIDILLTDIVGHIRDKGSVDVSAIAPLHSKTAALPELLKLSIIDADGMIKDQTDDEPPESNRASWIEAVAFQKSHLAENTLFISSPALTGEKAPAPFFLSRPIAAADGRFLGIALASTAPAFLYDALEGTLTAPGGMTAVLSMSTREVMAHLPYDTSAGALTKAIFSFPGLIRGSAVTIRCADGRKRIFGIARVPHYPLVVAVGISRDAVLSDWWAEERLQVALQAGFAACVLVLAWRLTRSERERARAALLLTEADRNHLESLTFAVEERTRELARSNAELEQFSYAVSHDLQEPLRMVSSYLTLLERRYRGRLDNEAREFIDFAVDGAQRMSRMITDLLEYSRIHTRGADFAPVNLGVPLGEALANLATAVEAAHATVKVEPLPNVRGDASQLMRLFQNLIGNALKYRSPDVPPIIHISAEEDREQWVVTVADNGIGIDPKQIDRLFQVFQRLHGRDQYEGTGIGLALCRRIVERHGGRIWAESAGEGLGAAFHFTLGGAENKADNAG